MDSSEFNELVRESMRMHDSEPPFTSIPFEESQVRKVKQMLKNNYLAINQGTNA